ncbi:hypothetical protein SUGI_1010380 [Cryptomeria japonica]|uniref:AP2/ERF and B3 domain-containing transcription factor RAV1-like n=1 Tax=Cryptomeria japonica TaxID=3369 RepID=UPI002414B749|nr:AP2/ERF and B3 domain-containing transcription factor RAV1-like [Cryptomeria japonica]GLJ47845.1 hypothetical protein SUGI_1010380 [Cryptomeria japonica]
MEKGFSKETYEEGYESPDSRLKFEAISEHLSDKESISSVLDSTGSKSLGKDNDNGVEADGNEIDQAKGESEARESKNIQGREERKGDSPQFKGTVWQRNGHWGAQLYCNHGRIWLGTFRTREEAAKAYNRAYMKFRGQDDQPNLPCTPVSEAEKLFQDSLSPDEVALFIRDHIYDRELQKWCNAHHRPNQEVAGNQDAGEMGVNRQHLFEKKMTASDVSKLNRLAIPKQHAERHFPKEKLDVESETFLTFVDTSNSRQWQFRFSFWKSSQSYVLTRGWRRFIKSKDLKGGDIVSFSRDSKMPSNEFYITVHVSQNLMSENCVQDQSGSHELLQEKGSSAISNSLTSVGVPKVRICKPKELVKVKSQEKIRVGRNTDHIHYSSHQKTSNRLHGSAQLGKRKAMADESEHNSDDVIKLFGIEIGRKAEQLKDDAVENCRKAKKHLQLQIHPKEIKQKDGEVEMEVKEAKGLEWMA